VSPHAPVEYFVGDFDPAAGKFIPRHSGILDESDNYYAPNSLEHLGQRIVWGWVKGFKPDQGWNGCLSLPRVLSLDPENVLQQKPAHQVRKLRGEHFRLSELTLEGVHPISGVSGDSLEVYLELELFRAAAVQLQLRRSDDGSRAVPITFDGTNLEVAGSKVPFQLRAGERTLKLDLFLDKSALELFANDRTCVTRVVYPHAQDLGVALSASAGTARIRSFHAWKIKTIW